MDRISAAGTTTLGSMATAVTGEPTADTDTDDQVDEHDDFPWGDAARWQPNDSTDELTRDRLDIPFSEIPAEQIGTVQNMGWFGLIRHDDQPGGIVPSHNAYSFRCVWETNSGDE